MFTKLTTGLLALVLVLVAPPVSAQNNPEMAEMIRRARATADQMEGKLPPEEIAQMRRDADELAQAYQAGAFDAPVPQDDPADVTARLMREHGGIVDWLETETACAGYSWETYKVYRLDTGDRDAERDVLCRTAYGHFAEYRQHAVDGRQADAWAALEAYDRAAHAAVDFYN